MICIAQKRRALAPHLSGPSPCLVRRTSGCRSAATPPPDRRRATRGRPRCSEDHPTRYVYNARGPHGLPACCNDPGRVTLVHRSILYMNKCKKMMVCACLFSIRVGIGNELRSTDLLLSCRSLVACARPRPFLVFCLRPLLFPPPPHEKS